jgi:DNA-binding ferritin-like protein
LGELDLVSQDLVNGVLAGIEKKLWFFEAHRPGETG